MRNKLLLGVLFVVLLGVLFLKRQFAYPQAWDEIQLGMSRQEVYDRAGPPTYDLGEVKGAFWFQKKLTQRQELWMYFDEDKVTMFAIKQRIGTENRFYERVVSSAY